MAFLVLGMIGFISAVEDEEGVTLPSANPTGFFGRTMDRWALAWTFNAEKKMNKSLELAEKRLAEAEILAETNPEAAELARERYEFFLGKAQDAMQKIEDREARDLNRSQAQLEKIAQIQNRFEEHREKVDAIHTEILERMQARNASQEQIAKVEEAFGKANERFTESIARVEERQSQAQLKYKVLGDFTDEQVRARIAQIENQSGLLQQRAQRLIRAEERNQRFSEIQNREMERIRERLNANGNLTKEQKQLMEQRIEMSKERLEVHKQAIEDLIDDIEMKLLNRRTTKIPRDNFE